MKTFYTSDLHFLHKNIAAYTERHRVVSAEEHDEWLVDLWNSQVRKQDKVFHLGDFAYANSWLAIKAIVKRLNGQKFFLKGNHDRREHLAELKAIHAIQNWHEYLEMQIGGHHVCMFHFPIAAWHKQHYGAFHLHGHSHGSHKGKGRILDVGLDSAYNILGEHRFFTEEDILQLANVEKHVGDYHTER